jgi:hypothetical protein
LSAWLRLRFGLAGAVAWGDYHLRGVDLQLGPGPEMRPHKAVRYRRDPVVVFTNAGERQLRALSGRRQGDVRDGRQTDRRRLPGGDSVPMRQPFRFSFTVT